MTTVQSYDICKSYPDICNQYIDCKSTCQSMNLRSGPKHSDDPLVGGTSQISGQNCVWRDMGLSNRFADFPTQWIEGDDIFQNDNTLIYMSIQETDPIDKQIALQRAFIRTSFGNDSCGIAVQSDNEPIGDEVKQTMKCQNGVSVDDLRKYFTKGQSVQFYLNGDHKQVMYLPKTFVTGANTVDPSQYAQVYGQDGWMTNDIYYQQQKNLPCVACTTYCSQDGGPKNDCNTRYWNRVQCPIIYTIEGAQYDPTSQKSNTSIKLYGSFKNPMEFLYPPSCDGNICVFPGCGDSYIGYDQGHGVVPDIQQPKFDVCQYNKYGSTHCNNYQNINQSLYECINTPQ